MFTKIWKRASERAELFGVFAALVMLLELALPYFVEVAVLIVVVSVYCGVGMMVLLALQRRWAQMARALAGLAMVLLVATAALALGVGEGRLIHPIRKEQAVRMVLAESGLNRLPASARDVEISTIGNMFSRSFEISFVASTAEVDAWVSDYDERVARGLRTKFSHVRLVRGEEGRVLVLASYD